jgi:hypothetical protein
MCALPFYVAEKQPFQGRENRPNPVRTVTALMKDSNVDSQTAIDYRMNDER